MKPILNLMLIAPLATIISCTAEEDPTDSQRNPEACFNFEPAEGNVGDEFTFTNCSESATHFVWDFGDGEFSTQREPVHIYEEIGTYEVTLLAGEDINSDGVLNASDDPASIVHTIEILPQHAVELTIYSASSWTPENPEYAVVPNANIYFYKDDQNMSELGEPDYTFTSDENGKLMFYKEEVLASCFVVEKDGESNIVNGYLIEGVFESQEEIDSFVEHEGATIGGLRFEDRNADGVISAADQTLCGGIHSRHFSDEGEGMLTQDVFIGN